MPAYEYDSGAATHHVTSASLHPPRHSRTAGLLPFEVRGASPKSATWRDANAPGARRGRSLAEDSQFDLETDTLTR